jgi:hypothetical protein
MILNQKVPNLTNNSWRRNTKLPTKSAWNAMAEVFSDDLNLNIGDLILHHLYHATRKPSARLFMLMHVYARASLKLRASLTSAPIAGSGLFSNPLSYISKVARQSGRAASAGGHHGGPRGATRRSQPGSPGGGARRQPLARRLLR